MSGYTGALDAIDLVSDYAATVFVIRQILAGINTATLVQVVASTADGSVAPPGFVDVQPLVQQIDGLGNVTPHGVVHRLKYLRVQGGANAVIVDPAVGDIGVAVFADRDTSGVIASGKASPPGSRRRFDYADGVYLGCIINAAPSQYVQFSNAGIAVSSPTKITLSAGGSSVVVDSSGVFINGINFVTHVHSGVQSGGSNTGPVA